MPESVIRGLPGVKRLGATAIRGDTVRNASGSTVTVGMPGYIDSSGGFKLAETDGYIDNWAVVLIGGADGSLITIARHGLVSIIVNDNCAVGDWLKLSSDAGQAGVIGDFVTPSAFAVVQAANNAGAGGTCEALLMCNLAHVPITSDNNLISRSGVSDSEWSGTINGAVSGANVVYTTVSGDEAILSLSATEIGLIVLHNTASGESAVILSCDTGTNTITVTDAADVATWQNGDTITIRSQTNTDTAGTGVYFIDVYLTAEIPLGASSLTLYTNVISDSGGTGPFTMIHPFEPGVAAKRKVTAGVVVAGVSHRGAEMSVNINNRRFCLAFNASGANTLAFTLRIGEVFVKAP